MEEELNQGAMDEEFAGILKQKLELAKKLEKEHREKYLLAQLQKQKLENLLGLGSGYIKGRPFKTPTAIGRKKVNHETNTSTP